LNAVVFACSVESGKTFVAERAVRTARETFGVPFDASARSFAFAARDPEQGMPLAVLLMTIAGGVAAIDELVVESPERDAGAATLLVRRFEETASYNNCHKACARVMRDGSTAQLLASSGFRIAAVLPRHYFQAEFVDFVKWLQ
jgi:hypothetical protein